MIVSVESSMVTIGFPVAVPAPAVARIPKTNHAICFLVFIKPPAALVALRHACHARLVKPQV
jgi:hypothetical protein